MSGPFQPPLAASVSDLSVERNMEHFCFIKLARICEIAEVPIISAAEAVLRGPASRTCSHTVRIVTADISGAVAGLRFHAAAAAVRHWRVLGAGVVWHLFSQPAHEVCRAGLPGLSPGLSSGG